MRERTTSAWVLCSSMLSRRKPSSISAGRRTTRGIGVISVFAMRIHGLRIRLRIHASTGNGPRAPHCAGRLASATLLEQRAVFVVEVFDFPVRRQAPQMEDLAGNRLGAERYV